MIFAFCAVLLILFMAALFSQDRAQKRAMDMHEGVIASYRVELAHLVERLAQERQRHREEMTSFITAHEARAASEREDHRAEVQMLFQRIQAPEVAVIQHQIETAGPPEMTYPLNDAESAKRQEQELLARIMELENKEAMNGY